MTYDDFDWTQIAAYLAGEGTPAERRAVEQWLAEDPRRHAAAVRAAQGWNAIHPSPIPPTDATNAWPAIARLTNIPADILARPSDRAAAMTEPPRARSHPVAKQHRPMGRTATYALLASIAMVTLFGVGIRVVRFDRQADASEMRVYQTRPGQQATVRLAGGSVMTLAPATTVQVTGATVTITGEARFAIVPNPERPFTVQTSQAIVRVLGTTFVVRHYHGDRESRVVVEDGKVALRPLAAASSRAQSILTARMLGRVTDSSVTVTPDIALEDYTGWTKGSLVFNETPLRDAVAELARAYGTEIRIADSALARRSLTMKASIATQPVTQVLEFIGRATDAHYTRQGNTFVLSPGRIAKPTSNAKEIPQQEKQYGR